MNITNLNKLIAHMEIMPDKAFDLSRWMSLDGRSLGYADSLPPDRASDILEKQADAEQHDCNTVACIAGEAAIIARAERFSTAGAAHIELYAQNWLGLTEHQRDALFTPGNSDHLYRDKLTAQRQAVTRAQAVTVLKHLRDTGRVSWAKAGVRFR